MNIWHSVQNIHVSSCWYVHEAMIGLWSCILLAYDKFLVDIMMLLTYFLGNILGNSLSHILKKVSRTFLLVVYMYVLHNFIFAVCFDFYLTVSVHVIFNDIFIIIINGIKSWITSTQRCLDIWILLTFSLWYMIFRLMFVNDFLMFIFHNHQKLYFIAL